MQNDLALYTEYSVIETDITLGDARSISVSNHLNKVDCVITSPPYPNEKDYSRTTRLESVILGFIKTKDDLRKIKKDLSDRIPKMYTGVTRMHSMYVTLNR